jgi:hypothetical protein
MKLYRRLLRPSKQSILNLNINTLKASFHATHHTVGKDMTDFHNHSFRTEGGPIERRFITPTEDVLREPSGK